MTLRPSRLAPLLAVAALAATPHAEATLPAALATSLPGARLIGQAHLRVWGYAIYDAQLWAPAGFDAARYADSALALQLTYLHAFKAKDIAARSIQEMRRSAAIDPALAARWTADLLRVIPDVRSGDRVLGVYRPGQGVQFWVNGQPHGEIQDAEFARLFFGIWLSPNTSEPALRSALIRGAGS